MEPMYPKQDQMKVLTDNFRSRWMAAYEKFQLEKKIIPQGDLNRYARKGSRGHKIMHGGQLYYFKKKNTNTTTHYMRCLSNKKIFLFMNAVERNSAFLRQPWEIIIISINEN